MKQKSNLQLLLIGFLPPILVGILSSLLSGGNMRSTVNMLRQPPLAPPAFLFPIVWTILYLLMGLATYIVLQSHAYRGDKVKALFAFYVQLFLNFIWSPVFFNLGMQGLALLILIVMFLVTLVTTLYYYQIEKIAGFLLVPYVLWLFFALYLNIGFVLLN